jgi:hypothetical protein
MRADCAAFAKGCILCSIYKHDNKGKAIIGTPLKISRPRQGFQIDIVKGLPKTRGCDSYLNIVDLFSGFSIPIPLKSESSANVASILESVLIKCFGIPEFISSDNAANLAGSEIVTLLKFYGIHHHRTTPYSPTSHSVVENSNRYVTQLMRLFADQYRSSWLDVLTLSALTMNSLPRTCLMNKSPFYMFHGYEVLAAKQENEKFLNMNKISNELQNDRNFARLAADFLYRFRLKHNERIKRTNISLPPGTLVYIKNYAPGPKRKIKPIYVKQPMQVIAEYKNVVYCKDLFNKISRHSKSNVRAAGPRSAKLFEKLPDPIKVILGAPLSLAQWNDINKEKTNLPDYLQDIELDFEDEKRSRRALPADTHLLEKSINESTEESFEEEEDWSDILNHSVLNKLKFLHDTGKLTDDKLRLEKLDTAFPDLKSKAFPRILSGIDADQILPIRLRKRVVINESKNTFKN